MIGIVIAESKCDTIAIPAATEVSLPYPPGITRVLRPSGIASEQMVHTMIFADIGINLKRPMKIIGNTSSLMIDAT